MCVCVCLLLVVEKKDFSVLESDGLEIFLKMDGSFLGDVGFLRLRR